MLTYILFKTQSMLLSALENESKNLNLHSVCKQTTFLLISSLDQLHVDLLSV